MSIKGDMLIHWEQAEKVDCLIHYLTGLPWMAGLRCLRPPAPRSASSSCPACPSAAAASRSASSSPPAWHKRDPEVLDTRARTWGELYESVALTGATWNATGWPSHDPKREQLQVINWQAVAVAYQFKFLCPQTNQRSVRKAKLCCLGQNSQREKSTSLKEAPAKCLKLGQLF